MDQREVQLIKWLSQKLDTNQISLEPIAGDASFRRYFRLSHNGQSYVAMDAPPEKEPSLPFVKISNAFRSLNLNTPEIFHEDLTQGYLLISDFGNQLYLNELTRENAEELYQNAINDLFTIQSCQSIPDYQLESFNDHELMMELNYFTEWFLENYLHLRLDEKKRSVLKNTYDILLNNAWEQPQVCIHRDYHSRNLMKLDHDEVGILDFQDAMTGPITYDLVSLIRDCYIDWPVHQVIEWALNFRQQAITKKLMPNITEETFLKWFDLTGMQRHLKATFIFARKYLRDQDDRYLPDISRALNYVRFVSSHYKELHPFFYLLTGEILPYFEASLVNI